MLKSNDDIRLLDVRFCALGAAGLSVLVDAWGFAVPPLTQMLAGGR